MILRLLLLGLTLTGAAQDKPSLFGQKIPPATEPSAEPAGQPPATVAVVPEKSADTSVVITPFRPPTLPAPDLRRTFQLSRLNKPGATETTAELRRLYSLLNTQRIKDGSPHGSSQAVGSLAKLDFTILQSLGDNRFLAKATWPAAGLNGLLPAGTDSMVILLLDAPAKVGSTGKLLGMHVGTVALLFTAEFTPLAGTRLTLRREAFVQCVIPEDSAADFQGFHDGVIAGQTFGVMTSELANCPHCGGLKFTREPQKGQLLDKRIDCLPCAKTGKVAVVVETVFAP